jgi:hypothetical protein
MTFSSVADYVAFVLVVLGSAALLALLVPRLRARGPGLARREALRVDAAVRRYAFWLEWYDVPRRRRRELRDDLRANLWESARVSGAREAVARLGGIRALAREAALADPARYERPRWELGLSTGIVAGGGVLLAQLFLALAWLDAAHASGAARVSSSTVLLPGADIAYTQEAGGFAAEASLGYLSLIAFGLAFLAASRPWRVLRGRRAAGR